MKPLLIFAALSLSFAFAQTPPDVAALEQAVKDYLTENKNLDMSAVRLKLDDVELRENEASANVAYYIEGREMPMMLYRYTFERKDGAWRVLESAPLAGGAAPAATAKLDGGAEPPLDAMHMHMLQAGQAAPPPAVPEKGNYPAWLGIVVMLNNFFHDLAVAMFFCAWMALVALAGRTPRVEELERLFKKTAGWSFGFILAFGVVRTLAYKDFEWYPAAEKGQVAALVVKHVLFVAVILAGWIYLKKRRRENPPSTAGRG